jgi:hypothetical protein
VCLLHDNAGQHTAENVEKFEKFDWRNLYQRHFSHDLAPCNFPPFPKNKDILGGKRMTIDEEVKETVTDSFNGLAGSSSLCNDWTIA